MDQIKIGQFIQEKRKEKGLTQNDLADKLNISNRAISKWENGVCLPDASNMQELCRILDITINDLFEGEVVSVENKDKVAEEHIMALISEKERTDKFLLNVEIAIGVVASFTMLGSITVISFIDMQTYLRIIIGVAGVLIGFAGIFIALALEQRAGYYECQECHHRYVPTYGAVLIAPHVNRTRYMKCPCCHKKSWQRKVISK